MSFCPVPTATPTKSITNEGQTVATVHPQPPPAETVIQPSHCVAGYSDGTIRIFDLGKVEMIMKMQPHGASITAISFSADGKEMASLKARWGVYFLLKRNAQNVLLFNLQTRY